MLEISTIARPYAEAVYQVACNEGSQQNWFSWLGAWAKLVEQSEVKNVLDNPKLTSENIVCLLLEISKTSEIKSAKNFLEAVVDNSRIEALPEIFRQFSDLKSKGEGVSEAVITSPFEMSEQEIQEIIPILEKKFCCKLKPILKIDPHLIGGIRVTVGDQEYDTSVRAQLKAMRVALIA